MPLNLLCFFVMYFFFFFMNQRCHSVVFFPCVCTINILSILLCILLYYFVFQIKNEKKKKNRQTNMLDKLQF